MDIVPIIDLITLLVTISTFLILLIFWKKNLSVHLKLILIILLSLNLFHSSSNFLEWANITNFLDPYEDFIQVLEPVLWFILFLAFIQKISRNELKKSESKSRQAYDRAEFYKDIFTHDINNILQNILASAELCYQYQNQSEKRKDMKDVFNIIEDQVMRGANLVSNIRKLSDIEISEWSINSIQITPVINDLIEPLINKFHNKNINIQFEKPERKFVVLANQYLKDVFENILINSIMHNRNPIKEVNIRISEIQKEGKNYVKTEFLDNGIGIENIRKEKIFQREQKKNRIFFGQGLGLSLVKKIIDAYNGQIWVEDKVPGDHLKGSNFIVLIPEASQIK